MKIRRVATLRTADDLAAHVAALGIALPFDAEMERGPTATLAQPLIFRGRSIGNRFAVLPMEGWDGTEDGRPTELVRRRWAHFGASGAKLIWGGEAVAVRPDGRANPHQLMINEATVGELEALRTLLVAEHTARHGSAEDLLIGLQLTHSGRFARPRDKKRMEPAILYHHPVLDARFGLAAGMPVMTDDAIAELIEDFIRAARLAQAAGFDFVDVKHCHGYLGHEFLSAVAREGRYGGSLANRTRFVREITAGIRRAAPGLEIGVRLSAFDFVPFQRSGDEGEGAPSPYAGAYPYAFGGDGTGTGINLDETVAFLDVLEGLGIGLVCVTGGSPYYNPHIQRPALFPPSDGYQPPEDPLVGVARQIEVAAELKRRRPNLLYVGSGYSYLQEWLPQVAQAAVRRGLVDSVGLGRMMLAYPGLAGDVLAGRLFQRKLWCRTFSDCTTAPRNGMVSGCYPLDEYYKARPEAAELAEIKKASKG